MNKLLSMVFLALFVMGCYDVPYNSHDTICVPSTPYTNTVNNVDYSCEQCKGEPDGYIKYEGKYLSASPDVCLLDEHGGEFKVRQPTGGTSVTVKGVTANYCSHYDYWTKDYKPYYKDLKEVSRKIHELEEKCSKL